MRKFFVFYIWNFFCMFIKQVKTYLNHLTDLTAKKFLTYSFDCIHLYNIGKCQSVRIYPNIFCFFSYIIHIKVYRINKKSIDCLLNNYSSDFNSKIFVDQSSNRSVYSVTKTY